MLKCGADYLMDTRDEVEPEEGKIYCDGKEHWKWQDGNWAFAGFCPDKVKEDRKKKIEEEEEVERSFENFEKERQPRAFEKVQKFLKSYLENRKLREYLIFAGPTGTGKTHLALALYRELLIEGEDVEFIRYLELSALFREFKKTGEIEILNRLVDKGVLIIDDIGSSKVTDSWLECFQYILDKRDGKPLVITTNLNKKDLEALLGQKIYSRLMEYGEGIVFKGEDYRLIKRKRESERTKN